MENLSNEARSAIEPFLKEWGLPTLAERVQKRTASSMEQISAFYEAMLPHMEEIIAHLNRFPLDAIPEDSRQLANAALAMCEIDNPVRWGEVLLPSGFDVLSMVEKTSLYDSRF
jgi:hypothetical protein